MAQVVEHLPSKSKYERERETDRETERERQTERRQSKLPPPFRSVR
jgi:hypothetical protein